MKIVFLIDYFQPKIGYQEYFLAKEIQKLGHQVFVVTSNYFFPFPDYKHTVYKVLGERKRKIGVFNEEGVTVYRLPMLFQTKNGAVTILANLKETLIKIKPDIVFSDGVFTPLAAQIAFLKKKLGFRLFYDNHAADFNTDLRNSLLKRIYMLFFKLIFIPFIKRNADGFSSIGEAEDLLLKREYSLKTGQTEIIRLGADTLTFFRDPKKRKSIREKLGIENGEMIFIYVGKITKRKEIAVLLKAASLIPSNQRDFKILMVGGREQRYFDFLRKIISENNLDSKVKWLEAVKNERLPELFNAADVAIWPGDISNAVSEAMACGLPIIIPDWFGSNYLLKSQAVFIFKRGDTEALKNILLNIIKNEKTVAAMGIKAEQYIRDNQSWQVIAKQTLNFFKKTSS